MVSESLKIAGTERSPEIEFDFERGFLRFRGESYPEDASAVFGPVFVALDRFLAEAGGREIQAEFDLAYFNSSSAKALMNIFLRLDSAAAAGTPVSVRWLHAPDDDTMREFGEDFGEDLDHVVFTLVAADPAG
ncbi:DUF1987 domain-containing protein [Magnetospirillum fulvum]|uniref:SiaC family regulatory phosphoprotein domain-containing protein n=1 Tax=Magnetospirillum fulvum MGU-K5 TaxID=1316936 RepID=S9S733_MAGFU|nr:DUF1987 domain-containing protein [Magnetospirillum fulvum]EPY01647.1 hypothetical protein K678_10043 [Magnetospirillum fulvum MGU-K5]